MRQPIFSPKHTWFQILRGKKWCTNTYFSDIDREKIYFSDIKGENGAHRWTQRDLLSGTLKSFPMGKGGKVILRGRMNIWSLIGGLSKVFRWIASHLECWKCNKVQQVWLSSAPLRKKVYFRFFIFFITLAIISQGFGKIRYSVLLWGAEEYWAEID